jgi:hypothetical protein
MASIEFIRSIQDDFESVFGMAVDTTDNKVKVMSRYGDLENSDGAIQNFTTINMYWTSIYSGKNAPASSNAGLTYFWAPEPVFDHNSSPYKRGRMDRYIWSGEFRKNSSGKTVFAGSNIGSNQTDGYMTIPRSYFDPTKRATQPGAIQDLPFEQDGVRIKIKSNLPGGLPANTFIPLCGYVLSRRAADRFFNQGAEMENAFGKGYQYFWSEPNNESWSSSAVGDSSNTWTPGVKTNSNHQTERAQDKVTFRDDVNGVEISQYEWFLQYHDYDWSGQPVANIAWSTGFYQKGAYFDGINNSWMKDNESIPGGAKHYFTYSEPYAVSPSYEDKMTLYTQPADGGYQAEMNYGIHSMINISPFLAKYGGAYHTTYGQSGRTSDGWVNLWDGSNPPGSGFLANYQRATYLNSSPISSENPVMGHIPSTIQDRVPTLDSKGLYSTTNYAKNSLIYGYPLIGPDLLKPFFGTNNPSLENENLILQGRSDELRWQQYPGMGGEWLGDNRYKYEKWHDEGWLSNGIENNTIWIMYAHDGAGKAMLIACPGEIMDRDGSETAATLNSLNPYNKHYTTLNNPGHFLWEQPKFYSIWFDSNKTLSDLWSAAGFGGSISRDTLKFESPVHSTFSHRLITMHWCNLADRTLDTLLNAQGSFTQTNNALYNTRSSFSELYAPNYARYWDNFNTMSGKPFRMYTNASDTSKNWYKPDEFTHDDGIYSHVWHLGGSVLANPILNRSTLMAYGPVSNANLASETEFLLNINTQYVTSEDLSQAWGISDVGLYNGQVEGSASSSMFTDGRVAAGDTYLAQRLKNVDLGEGQSYGSMYNHKAYIHNSPVAQGQFMTNYLSGSINGLKFYNVPGQSCLTSNVANFYEGQIGTNMEFGYWSNYMPYEERGCFWPALILRPSIENDIEISEFSFAYFAHDYEMSETGGAIEGLNRVYQVNPNMPYKFGDYGYSYDPFKNIKLPSENEGYVPIDPVEGWSNVENLIDKDVNTKARITKSGPDNAIYLPLSKHLNDDSISNPDQLKVKNLTLNIKGVSIFGLNAHAIKAQIVKSDKATVLMQTGNAEGPNSHITEVPLNSVGSWPADDAGFMIVFEGDTADIPYSNVRDGFAKIWVDPV